MFHQISSQMKGNSELSIVSNNIHKGYRNNVINNSYTYELIVSEIAISFPSAVINLNKVYIKTDYILFYFCTSIAICNAIMQNTCKKTGNNNALNMIIKIFF